MSPAKLAGFISRLEAVEEYHRSEQSFRRDFEKARNRGDAAFLKQVKVLLNDGAEVDGTEIKKGDIDQLNSEGKAPEVFIARDLLETRYWKRGKKKKEEGTGIQPQVRSSRTATKVTESQQLTSGDQSGEIATLKARLDEKDERINDLRTQLTQINAREKERNKLETARGKRDKETNQIMRELGVAIGELKREGRIPSEAESKPDIPITVTPEQAKNGVERPVQEAEVVEPSDHPHKEAEQRSKKRRTSTAKRKIPAPKGRVKKTTPTKQQQEAKKKLEQYKWNEFPTVKRVFSRFR